MQITTAGAVSGFQRPPLCRSYAAVQLGALYADIRVLGGKSSCSMTWGLGIASDGQVEPLGVWPTAPLCLKSARQVADELLARGTERVGILINGASAETGTATLRAFRGSSATLPFPPAAQLLSWFAPPRRREAIASGLKRIRRAESVQHAHAVLDALEASTWQGAPKAVKKCRSAIEQWRGVYALSMRAREVVRRGEDSAELLEQRVRRVLARHGPFESAEAAAVFAELWLIDAESLARRRKLAAVRKSELAAASAAT
ncbi:MAG: transposase [Burkholderiaceae bacterium]|nr:transposase [Burkholderiaceae bacterium]